MDNDRRRAKEQMKALPFKEKLKNFWYYYKIHTIVLIFAVIVFGWSAVRCSSRIDYDLEVSFYSSRYVSDESLAAFDEFLKSKIEDANQNGSVDAKVYLYNADIEAEYLDQDAQTVITRLQAEFAAGECQAYIVDEAFKNYILNVFGDMEVVEKITDITDEEIIKQTLKPADDVKLYWISIVEYDTHKDDKEIAAERKNAEIIESYFDEN